MPARRLITMTARLALLALALTAASLYATIFSALPSALEDLQRSAEERLGIKKSVDTSFGVARVDESKDPPEVSVGELRSLWKGTWQLNGAKLDINRAKATDLVFSKPSASFKVKVRWVAGNEAVARSADHAFELKILRVENDVETLVETVKKDVSVGAKGLGGTVFKNGHLISSKIAVNGPIRYRLALRTKNGNTGASLETSTTIEFKKS